MPENKDELQAEIAKLKERIAESEKSNAELVTEKSELEAKHGRLVQESKAAEAGFSKDKEILEAEIQGKITELTDTKTKLTEAQTELATIKSESADKDTEVDKLTKELKETEGMLVGQLIERVIHLRQSKNLLTTEEVSNYRTRLQERDITSLLHTITDLELVKGGTTSLKNVDPAEDPTEGAKPSSPSRISKLKKAIQQINEDKGAE